METSYKITPQTNSPKMPLTEHDSVEANSAEAKLGKKTIAVGADDIALPSTKMPELILHHLAGLADKNKSKAIKAMGDESSAQRESNDKEAGLGGSKTESERPKERFLNDYMKHLKKEMEKCRSERDEARATFKKYQFHEEYLKFREGILTKVGNENEEIDDDNIKESIEPINLNLENLHQIAVRIQLGLLYEKQKDLDRTTEAIEDRERELSDDEHLLLKHLGDEYPPLKYLKNLKKEREKSVLAIQERLIGPEVQKLAEILLNTGIEGMQEAADLCSECHRKEICFDRAERYYSEEKDHYKERWNDDTE
jgi:hypothetical protein